MIYECSIVGLYAFSTDKKAKMCLMEAKKKVRLDKCLDMSNDISANI